MRHLTTGLLTGVALLALGASLVAAPPKSVPSVKPSQAELHQRLTPEQYACTQDSATEKPFANAYWDNHADGLYVDLVSGEPLFSSLDKFDSGTGWPSFSRPLGDALVTRTDTQAGMARTEVRSKGADSHLGHVFEDGPKPSGKRFCINSAALRFVPVAEMASQGYGRYVFAFAERKKWDVATLAGGCFWGTEEILGKLAGVVATQVGYTGGTLSQATYEAVASGETGHAETVQILFDPAKISYETLLLHFFRMHDPTTKNRQANDRGTQYRSAVFYANDAQKQTAQQVMTRVEKSGAWKAPLVTELTPLGVFWPAEDYHQHYLDKHPNGYRCHTVHSFTF